MRFRPRVAVALSALSALALVAACSDHQATTPATPSSPTAAAPAPAVGSATIAGTVVGMSSASATGSSVRGMGMTVTVVGTSSGATIDGSGHFTLTNVPPGRVDLHFMGNGADAHLILNGVASNQTLTISVRVSGSSASLDDDRSGPNTEVQLEGTVTSTSANTITVLGRQVNVTNSTVIVRGGTNITLSSIHTGDRVQVKGLPASAPSGPINATRIELKNPNDDDDDDDIDDDDDDRNEVELKGRIANGSLAGSCATNSLSFSIGSTIVRSNAATRFKDTSCAALKAGDSVEVKGTRQANASVLASRIERK